MGFEPRHFSRVLKHAGTLPALELRRFEPRHFSRVLKHTLWKPLSQ